MPGRRILLVEGTDDENVIKHLCGNRGVGLIEITKANSVERLLSDLRVRLKESEVEALGMVLDADTDLEGRWHALQHRLTEAGYDPVPQQPAVDGTILAAPANSLLPRFGAWIMPDNRSRGILEDFLHFLVPSGSRLFEHVKSSVASIPEGERRFSQAAEPKAVLHTWLAWQKEPGRPLGTAIKARFLDPTVAEVDVFVGWLQRLYSAAPSA